MTRSLALVSTMAALLLLDHADGDVGEIADHAFDVAADVADLGVLGRLDLEERGRRRAGPARRAISVLPTPVGPIMMMFLGVTSLRISAGSCCRRQRLRMAMATARLAASWPTMYLSSSATISRGVKSAIRGSFFRFVVNETTTAAGDYHFSCRPLPGRLRLIRSIIAARLVG